MPKERNRPERGPERTRGPFYDFVLEAKGSGVTLLRAAVERCGPDVARGGGGAKSVTRVADSLPRTRASGL